MWTLLGRNLHYDALKIQIRRSVVRRKSFQNLSERHSKLYDSSNSNYAQPFSTQTYC
jgi:hypothetical protein